eukprot:TRINITY_DN25268_c0_g1_i1.p2 TRINITY_DN25268_c0_g1~~TRINITY_DN25268_c0_g1_i1.p2  ORF type:complete len:132 (+),score=43.13 TRINITY_DN25268_c0_g1_i1:97-492(+)
MQRGLVGSEMCIRDSYKGKRVVLLKALESGLCMVSGPYTINGVPLRRMNQAYIRGTSTKVSMEGVKTEKFDDKYFKRPAVKKTKKGFLEKKEEKKTVDASRVTDQKSVDTALLKNISKDAILKKYLGAASR